MRTASALNPTGSLRMAAATLSRTSERSAPTSRSCWTIAAASDSSAFRRPGCGARAPRAGALEAEPPVVLPRASPEAPVTRAMTSSPWPRANAGVRCSSAAAARGAARDPDACSRSGDELAPELPVARDPLNGRARKPSRPFRSRLPAPLPRASGLGGGVGLAARSGEGELVGFDLPILGMAHGSSEATSWLARRLRQDA